MAAPSVDPAARFSRRRGGDACPYHQKKVPPVKDVVFAAVVNLCPGTETSAKEVSRSVSYLDSQASPLTCEAVGKSSTSQASGGDVARGRPYRRLLRSSIRGLEERRQLAGGPRQFAIAATVGSRGFRNCRVFGSARSICPQGLM